MCSQITRVKDSYSALNDVPDWALDPWPSQQGSQRRHWPSLAPSIHRTQARTNLKMQKIRPCDNLHTRARGWLDPLMTTSIRGVRRPIHRVTASAPTLRQPVWAAARLLYKLMSDPPPDASEVRAPFVCAKLSHHPRHQRNPLHPHGTTGHFVLLYVSLRVTGRACSSDTKHCCRAKSRVLVPGAEIARDLKLVPTTRTCSRPIVYPMQCYSIWSCVKLCACLKR
jgi:hypothetical protein